MKLEKKSLAAVLGASMIMTQPSFSSAANPYEDVPASSWEYDAMNQLVTDGLVRGVTTFDKNDIITRNDMAVLVAKAYSKRSAASPEEQEKIDSLVKEYTRELSFIGVADENVPDILAKNSADTSENVKNDSGEEKWYDKITFKGYGRLRYDGYRPYSKDLASNNDGSSFGHINFEVFTDYKVNNNDWWVRTQSELGRTLNKASSNQNVQNQLLEKIYLDGSIGHGSRIWAGRYTEYSFKGVTYDDKVTGLRYMYDDDEKNFHFRVDAGRASGPNDEDILWPERKVDHAVINGKDYDYHSEPYFSTESKFGIGHNTNLHLGYHRIGGHIQHGQERDKMVNYYTLGVDSKVADNLLLEAVAVRSDAPDSTMTTNSGKTYTSSNKLASLLKLTYKEADMKKPGSFDIYALYRTSPQLATYSNNDDWVNNTSGFRIGGDYVIAENMGVSLYYTVAKDIDTKERIDSYRLQYNFQF